tara:strand:+ start:70 stop:882 length:813 start_codon:yes stop_codon:yes gene_type:complete
MDKFIENGNFIRIIEEFPPNVADHNRARTEWIGSGKTFKQINKPNSRYRNNINRTDYQGNNSSILQDLKYDIRKGWIKYLGPLPQNQIIGSSGEHLVLSNLLKLNFIAGLAPYNTENYDLLTLNEDGNASKSIQVKTALNLKKKDISKHKWVLKEKNETPIENLIFCFVAISMHPVNFSEVYVMDSTKVSEVIKMSHQIYLKLPGINGQIHNDNPMRSLAADIFMDVTNQYNRKSYHKYLSKEEVSFLDQHAEGWLEQYRNNWDILRNET